MKDNLDYILFAVKQEREAEAFGFTRNECCRNLKTALHQYWQNKTMGQHGHSQKDKLPRSKAAVGKDIKDCDVEHVVPQMVIVNMLIDEENLNKNRAEQILTKYYRVIIVTKEEHQRLNASGLRSSMPENWDGEDPWSRYKIVGIEI